MRLMEQGAEIRGFVDLVVDPVVDPVANLAANPVANLKMVTQGILMQELAMQGILIGIATQELAMQGTVGLDQGGFLCKTMT